LNRSDEYWSQVNFASGVKEAVSGAYFSFQAVACHALWLRYLPGRGFAAAASLGICLIRGFAVGPSWPRHWLPHLANRFW